MQENTDQRNSEYGHFSRSVKGAKRAKSQSNLHALLLPPSEVIKLWQDILRLCIFFFFFLILQNTPDKEYDRTVKTEVEFE